MSLPSHQDTFGVDTDWEGRQQILYIHKASKSWIEGWGEGSGGSLSISREKAKALQKKGKGKASLGEKGKGKRWGTRFEVHSH